MKWAKLIPYLKAQKALNTIYYASKVLVDPTKALVSQVVFGVAWARSTLQNRVVS